jgi:hypothetical protein
MESVQRCRNKLSSDKEECAKISEIIEDLTKEKFSLEKMISDLAEEFRIRKAEVEKLKNEEDTALVLLALSGHKIDERIKQRITSLCRSATELEILKSKISESHFLPENRESVSENRDIISETRMKQQSRCESYENTSIYEKDPRIHQESNMDTFNQELGKNEIPEIDGMKKLLHNLEVTQQRLKNLNPSNDLSFER